MCTVTKVAMQGAGDFHHCPLPWKHFMYINYGEFEWGRTGEVTECTLELAS